VRSWRAALGCAKRVGFKVMDMNTKPKRIDVHHHIVPPNFVSALNSLNVPWTGGPEVPSCEPAAGPRHDGRHGHRRRGGVALPRSSPHAHATLLDRVMLGQTAILLTQGSGIEPDAVHRGVGVSVAVAATETAKSRRRSSSARRPPVGEIPFRPIGLAPRILGLMRAVARISASLPIWGGRLPR
jgi:hypothetical protein